MRLDYKAQNTEFDAIWERRHQPPYVMDSWTDNEWANGRTQYLTCLIRVQTPKIIEKVASVQRELSSYRCVDPLPPEYLHLTVREVNGFLAEVKQQEDEYTRKELETISRQAAEVIKTYEVFDVKLKRLNNFTSVICVEGHDGGVIREINAELREKTGLPTLQHDTAFLPHMSVAQYRSSEDYSELIMHLEKKRETVIGPVSVECVELVIAHLPKQDGCPRLEVLEEFPLKH